MCDETPCINSYFCVEHKFKTIDIDIQSNFLFKRILSFTNYIIIEGDFDYIQSDYIGQDGIHYYLVKMKDSDDIEILSSQLSSKLIDEYTKWKFKNQGP